MNNNYYNYYNGTKNNDINTSNIEKELYWRKCIHKYRILMAFTLLWGGLMLFGLLCFFIPAFLKGENVSIWAFVFAKEQNTDSLNSLSDIVVSLKTQIYYDAKTEFFNTLDVSLGLLKSFEFLAFAIGSITVPLGFIAEAIRFLITFSDVESKIRLKSNPLRMQQFNATENLQRSKAKKTLDRSYKNLAGTNLFFVISLLLFPIHFGIFCQKEYFSGVYQVNALYYVLPILSLLVALVLTFININYCNVNKNDLIEAMMVLSTKY